MSTVLQTMRLQRPGTNPVFAELGILQGFKPKPLERSTVLLIGPTGSGKSTVIASMGPRTFIFDFDRTYCNIPCSRVSGVTPGVMTDPETGQDKVVNAWEHWIVCMEWLKSPEGRELYDTVVFDTVDQWVRLVESGMAHLINEKRKEAKPEEQRELLQSIVDMGKGGYKTLVDRLVIEWSSLRDAGYGLVFSGHLEHKERYVAELDRKVDIKCLGLYPSLDKVLRRQADYVVQVVRGLKKYTITRDRLDPKTGKKIGEVEKEQTYKIVRMIFDEEVVNVESSSYDTVKNRVEMPATVIIPENKRHEAWKIVSDVHVEACEKQARKHQQFTRGLANGTASKKVLKGS